MAGVSRPTWTPESLHYGHATMWWIFPGHQLKLQMVSLGRFYLQQVEAYPGICHGYEHPNPGPRGVGNCSENNVTPLLPEPRQERGEAAPESTAGAFPFPLMSH